MHIVHFLQGASNFFNLWLGLGLGLNAYCALLTKRVQFLKFIARIRVRAKCILCTSYKVRPFSARVRVGAKCISCTSHKVHPIFKIYS